MLGQGRPPSVPLPPQMVSLLVLVAVTSVSHKVVVYIPLGRKNAGVQNQGRKIQKPPTHPQFQSQSHPDPTEQPTTTILRLEFSLLN